MTQPIYLDNNATTPLDPRVLEAMMPFLTNKFGNAASRSHAFGWEAERAVDRARRQIGDLIGASAREIVFTSGATESDNLALTGAARMFRDKGDHIVSCRTEHKAVLDTLSHLEEEGIRVTLLEPEACGALDPAKVEAAIEDSTILVALMIANNEIGTVHPFAEIGAICRKKKVLFFADGAQAVGKIPVDVEAANIDVMAMSGHKFYGPKGVGALYVRRRNPTVRLAPQIHGGGHERGMRSGTLNVPGIVGMGEAARLAAEELPEETEKLSQMRDLFEARILEKLEDVRVNGNQDRRLPGTSNLSFAYVEGEALMLGLKNLAVSSGSACNSASLSTSHVLQAIGLEDDVAQATIRFSFGRFNTLEEAERASDEVVEAIQRLRKASLRLKK